jgi:hypothetical protein
MTDHLTTSPVARPRVYTLPVVREVPLPPADPGTTGTW